MKTTRRCSLPFSNVGFYCAFLCAEKAQQICDSDIQRKKEELDKQIEKLSRQCAETGKKSATVRHYYTPSTPKQILTLVEQA